MATDDHSRPKTHANAAALQLITKADACAILAVSVSTFERCMRGDPGFPQARRIGCGRTVRFVKSEVLAYVNARPRVAYSDHAFDPNERGDA